MNRRDYGIFREGYEAARRGAGLSDAPHGGRDGDLWRRGLAAALDEEEAHGTTERTADHDGEDEAEDNRRGPLAETRCTATGGGPGSGCTATQPGQEEDGGGRPADRRGPGLHAAGGQGSTFTSL